MAEGKAHGYLDHPVSVQTPHRMSSGCIAQAPDSLAPSPLWGRAGERGLNGYLYPGTRRPWAGTRGLHHPPLDPATRCRARHRRTKHEKSGYRHSSGAKGHEGNPMKETILLVGHGSRDPGGEGNREVELFAHLWRERQPDWDIQVCFIEFADLLVAEGLTQAARDADRVIVVPLILNAAGHVKMELPEHLQQPGPRPDTAFIYVPHLGAEDTILNVLKRRLGQAMDEFDRPTPRSRGSSSSAGVPRTPWPTARWPKWRAGSSRPATTTWWISPSPGSPIRLERVVQRQALLGMTQIIVLPYYLFTGSLMERIKRQMAHLRQQYPRLRFAPGRLSGFEDEIFDLLEQRVREGQAGTGLMPCDGCKYRELARDGSGVHRHHDSAPGHGHHHEHHHQDRGHPAHPPGGHPSHGGDRH